MIPKMKQHNLSKWLGLTLAIILGSGGCSDPDSPGTFDLNPVNGTVVLDDGKPLTSGRVILVSRELAMEFEGELDPKGGFRIGSNLGDGVPEGTYRIRIEPDESSLSQMKHKSATRKWRFPFPVRYSNEDTSDLTATVAPGENRLEPFRLTTTSARKSNGQGSGRTKG
jgi:hypothetical protein